MAIDRPPKRRRLESGSVEGSGPAVPGFAQWDLEQSYEQRSRKKNKKEVNERLPVKKADHWVQPEPDARDGEVDQEQEDDASVRSSGDDKESRAADPQPRREKEKPVLPPKEEIRQAKEELARIAGLVSESPEEHIGLLSGLAQMVRSKNVTVKKLALGTQLAVFKDIIPGYRIRPLTKDDLQAKLSKDVRVLRNFEHGLLGSYKDYVQQLSELAKDDENGTIMDGTQTVAISCVCNLLTSVPHFNLRNDLIAIIVQRLSRRTVDAEFSNCRQALETLFQNDDEGHSSLEVVNQVTRMMKARGYRIHESVLDIFLHLRLLSEFSHKASTNHIDNKDERSGATGKKAKQKREFRTKRERKLLKERKDVEKEMKEADASVSYEERDKNQAEMLKLVFVTYFRILKARTQHLMGAVLEGLAKYAHLINQDFFGDILEALKDLINDATASQAPEDGVDEQEAVIEDRNATREALLCVITAFALLQSQVDVVKSANSLHLDLDFFITHLYRTLLSLSMDQDLELNAKRTHVPDPNGLSISSLDTKVNVSTTTVLLLRSLQAVLLPVVATKMVPPLRIAAFTKQLSMLSLHLPQKSAVAVTSLLQQVSKVHGKKIATLWNSEERRGDGVFDATREEYESSNPFATTVWEGELLRLHFDPRVRKSVRDVEMNVIEAR